MRRGFALVVVLLASLALFSLAKVLVLLSHSEAFRSRHYYQRNKLRYLVESAVADARSQLLLQPDWQAGFHQKALSSIPGHYSLVFNQTGSNLQPTDSVNNLSGAAAMAGPRGQVPPGMVDLLVVAQAGGLESRVRVILKAGTGIVSNHSIHASGNIKMKGNVRISGIESLENPVPVATGVFSGKSENVADIITWNGAPGETADISGRVSTVSPNPGSIQFSGTHTTGGLQTGAAPAPVSTPDILATIASHSSLPAPTFNALGTSTVSADSYRLGDVSLQGDLVLSDADLYVQGDLTINGSISGKGSLHVSGKTTFRGDSQVLTNRGDAVALLSHDSVRLEGFDGLEFLNAAGASDPALSALLAETQQLLGQFQDQVSNHPINELLTPFGLFDRIRAHLGGGINGEAPLPGYQDSLFEKLENRVAALPSGATRDFMVKRLASLSGHLGGTGGANDNPISAWTAGQGGEEANGIWDAVINTSDGVLLPQLLAQSKRLGFDRIGSSSFSGVIYTNGAFYASHEVDIMGAVIINGDPTLSEIVAGSETLSAGDIYLDDGVSLTLNQALLSTALAGNSGATQISLWLEL